MEGMDVMSAMAQALPLHKLQCSNGEEANRFSIRRLLQRCVGAAMYPVSNTRELDEVRAVVRCTRSRSPKRNQADYMYDLIMAQVAEFFWKKRTYFVKCHSGA